MGVSKKTGKEAAAEPAEAQPASKQKKEPAWKEQKGKRSKDEIDDIFSSKPAKKKAPSAAAADGGGDAPADGGGETPADGGSGVLDDDPVALAALASKVKEAREKQQAKRPKVEGSKDDIFGASSGGARKRTAEGFAIYSEAELGLGKKGGDTDLCPFDCECCY